MGEVQGIASFLGKEVEVEISGRTYFTGILIDIGLDILVLYDGQKFLYIPFLHLHNIKEKIIKEINEKPPEAVPLQFEKESISYRKILMNAKGQFIEIFVTGNRSIHGYITSVLNDYVVFYSPVYKRVLISMQHLKWLTPYFNQLTPYTLNTEELPIVPSTLPLARSFEDELKKYKNQLIVFDLGDNPDKVGLMKNVSNNIVELVLADGQTVYWKLLHLKTVNFP
ncbi:DUF2642 domain-containing protein [Bacillus massilinigeriensis]|uniref:DUF2642 domain-containing protein n=1 Tax=Bacillus massilionigeriensis TaxID=1805475 RepID=UPI00096B0DF3|nr:DUF2642 domain-containing protein [Bacillus massilionigeriensis]